MILSLIAAYAKDEEGRLVIGRDNKIPWHSRADLQRFKEYTMGHPVIMGRKTHESIGRTLPGRKNVIVTTQDIKIPGAVIVGSMEEALAECEGETEAFIIGGQSLYTWALDRVERMYITEVDMVVPGDTFFPPYKLNHFKKIHTESVAGEKFSILQRFDRKTSAHRNVAESVDPTYNSEDEDVFFGYMV